MKIRLLALIPLLLYCFNAMASQRADSFIVTAYSSYYRVLAPVTMSKQLSIIIENKMLIDLIGRVESSKGALVANVRVPAGDYRTVTVDGTFPKEIYSFVPLNPAFQAVELKPGQEAYEIPPKR